MKLKISSIKVCAALAGIICLSACASGPPPVPYPAFIEVDELPDIFLAGMPGTRAKLLSGDPRSRRSSIRLALPADWNFSTGALPDKSVEIFVLEGAIKLGEFDLATGGYAFLPSGTLGMSMSTQSGAVLMYFLDNANPTSVIQTPLIMDDSLLEWSPVSEGIEGFGVSEKVFRADPGSGAVTRLVKVEPGALQGWRKRSVTEEGYFIAGNYQHSECVNGEVATELYAKGGYFMRPPGAVNGGPESKSFEPSVWLLRVPSTGPVAQVDACTAVSAIAQ